MLRLSPCCPVNGWSLSAQEGCNNYGFTDLAGKKNNSIEMILMGCAGSVIPILSIHLHGKRAHLEFSFSQNWKLKNLLFLSLRASSGSSWQPVDIVLMGSSCFPCHLPDFSTTEHLWFVSELVWVCWFWFVCLLAFFMLFWAFSPRRKLQDRNFLQNLQWFCNISQEKKFLSSSSHGTAKEPIRNQDLRVSQSATLLGDV